MPCQWLSLALRHAVVEEELVAAAVAVDHPQRQVDRPVAGVVLPDQALHVWRVVLHVVDGLEAHVVDAVGHQLVVEGVAAWRRSTSAATIMLRYSADGHRRRVGPLDVEADRARAAGALRGAGAVGEHEAGEPENSRLVGALAVGGGRQAPGVADRPDRRCAGSATASGPASGPGWRSEPGSGRGWRWERGWAWRRSSAAAPAGATAGSATCALRCTVGRAAAAVVRQRRRRRPGRRAAVAESVVAPEASSSRDDHRAGVRRAADDRVAGRVLGRHDHRGRWPRRRPARCSGRAVSASEATTPPNVIWMWLGWPATMTVFVCPCASALPPPSKLVEQRRDEGHLAGRHRQQPRAGVVGAVDDLLLAGVGDRGGLGSGRHVARAARVRRWSRSGWAARS